MLALVSIETVFTITNKVNAFLLSIIYVYDFEKQAKFKNQGSTELNFYLVFNKSTLEYGTFLARIC